MKSREGGVRAKAVSSLRKDDTLAWVLQNVDREGVDAIYTDANNIYDDLSDTVPHDSIDHSVSFAIGDLHTNGIEGFWSLLKRGVIGSYHHVSRKHLQRYVDEYCWRSNRTKDEEVFYSLLGAQVASGPLTYRELVTKRRKEL